MPTQAKKEGNARHIAKLDIIKIQPYREEGTAIRAAAAAAGKSVQGYVLEAIREKMERERAGSVPAVSPEVEDAGAGGTPVPGGGSGFPAHSRDDNSISRSLSLEPPNSHTGLDTGPAPQQEGECQERENEQRQRFRELVEIRRKRGLTSKEDSELMHLLCIHDYDDLKPDDSTRE